MQKITLKKILERTNAHEQLRSLISDCATPITVLNSEKQCLIPDLRSKESTLPADYSKSYPIMLDEICIGYVYGEEKADAVASFLCYLARVEADRRVLVAETLDKYREISFLCDFTGKIATCLDVNAVSTTVLEEAMRHITADAASVLLYHEENELLETITTLGENAVSIDSIKVGHGIVGEIFISGRAEIVNDLSNDPRCSDYCANWNALICAPLATKDKTLGVITLFRAKNHHFTSQDLKMFSVLTAQAASAIENVLLHESRLRQMEIRNRLGRYLSSRVVDSLIHADSDISLLTRKRKVTMLFSDIRNFSAKCEELQPEEIVSYLNTYFTSLVSVIFSHKGTVNKFVGDMIVAMFGAPEDLEEQELFAIRAAIGMQRCLGSLLEPWIGRNFLTGIGISSGESVVGNIGSAEHMDYTAIGDEVNIASRLQGLASGGQILVTRSVYDAVSVRDCDEFSFKEFGTITVKGKKIPVEIFEVIYR